MSDSQARKRQTRREEGDTVGGARLTIETGSLSTIGIIDTVFTLDRRDFSVYRRTDGRALDIVPDR